LSLQTDYF